MTTVTTDFGVEVENAHRRPPSPIVSLLEWFKLLRSAQVLFVLLNVKCICPRGPNLFSPTNWSFSTASHYFAV